MPDPQVIKLVNATSLDAGLSDIADAIRLKGGTSALLQFPDDFVDAIDAIQTGGSGTQIITQTTFTGPETSGRMWYVGVGNKMPTTDFFVRIQARNNSVFPRNGYSFTDIEVAVYNQMGSYDLSQTGSNRPFASAFTVVDDNNGVLTNKNAGHICKQGQHLSGGNLGNNTPNTFEINRDASGFSLTFGIPNASYHFPDTVTYDLTIIYFGSDPDNDIVTI